MSYLEILWWVGLGVVILSPLIFSCIMDCFDYLGEGTVLLIVFWVFGVGGISHMISDGINDYVVTAEFETTPKFVELTSDKLVMMSDEGEVFTYTDYKAIRKLSDGGKFYKVYKYKKCFGPDVNTFNVIIK